eukprot:7305535-Heterocapsa_arctica.AAC.1
MEKELINFDAEDFYHKSRGQRPFFITVDDVDNAEDNDIMAQAGGILSFNERNHKLLEDPCRTAEPRKCCTASADTTCCRCCNARPGRSKCRDWTQRILKSEYSCQNKATSR